MSVESLTIAARFNGPPRSGNGGYVAGRLAGLLDGTAAVRLRVPPPLDKPLQVRPTAHGLELYDGDIRVADARRVSLQLDPPPAVAPSDAEAASRRFPGYHSHAFPQCFVCGPAREPGDGLRVLPGPLDRDGPVAAPWTPDPSLAGDDGIVREEFVWAALDCPGAFALGHDDDTRALLLGEMTAEIRGRVVAGVPHVVLGWVIGTEGRKRHTGTALYDADGRCLAVARGTWFAVPRERIV